MHRLNTTPGSANAGAIFDAALETGNPYRIGVALHAFADSWAHQNFVGYYEAFNSMAGVLEELTPNIGHADAGHTPDWPAVIWKDRRLVRENERIRNSRRFSDAAGKVYEKMRLHYDPECNRKTLDKDHGRIIEEVEALIGEVDQTNSRRAARIERYQGYCLDRFGHEIPEYDEYDWFEDVVNERVRGLRDRSDLYLARWDPMTDIYTWKPPSRYPVNHWRAFQEAVKAHQDAAWKILSAAVFSKLDLKEL